MVEAGKRLRVQSLVLALVMITLLTACVAEKKSETPAPLQQQLRVSNTGSADIHGLMVYFPGLHPEAEATKLNFGDLAAGQTSAYLEAPTGVYAYAAYAYTLEGHEIIQPVTDWVGEAPIAGNKFTYQITLDLKKIEGAQMRLVKVVVDEP